MTRALLIALAASCTACVSNALLGEPNTTSTAGSSTTGQASTSASGATTASSHGTSSSAATTSATTAATTSASGGVTTAAASSTSGTTSSSTSGFTASSSSSGGGPSDGGFICPSSFTYVNGNCVAVTCVAGLATPCVLDAGVGTCTPNGCLNFNSDQDNCGGLGVICASDVKCINGTCQSPSSCAAGVCPGAATCMGGQCLFAGSCSGAPNYAECTGAAADDFYCCGGTCTGLTDDANNCGTCGNVCPTGSPCQGGACLPTTCAPGTPALSPCVLKDGGAGFSGSADIACCGTACVDVYSDPNNCGSCGEVCPSGHSCQEGFCSGGSNCSTSAQCGAGQLCNGGSCYVASTCSAGVSADGELCAFSDQITGICCAGACVSNGADSNNCGACGVVCGSGTCFDGRCTDTPLQCSQGADEGFCLLNSGISGTCCGGTCSALDDPSNCGGCGIICPTGSTCNNGGCSQECSSASDCAQGQACGENEFNQIPGVCLPEACTAANEGQPCGTAGGLTGNCCNGKCADYFSDSNNCGACGFACAAGSSCQGFQSGGPLIQCNEGETQNVTCTGQADCPSGTVCPVGADTYMCLPTCAIVGEGDFCAFGLNGTLGTCHSGQCIPPTCANLCPGGVCLTDSDGDFFCDSLGTTCPASCGPGTSCFNGTCTAVSCLGASDTPCPAQDGNVGLCEQTDAGVSCVDVNGDPNNCGAIGVVCPTGQTCAQGLCSGTPAPCNTPDSLGGFCNFDAGYGWNCCQNAGCVDLYNDVSNCGTCGNACGSGQTCTLGVCG